jgi:hypothetical protein
MYWNKPASNESLEFNVRIQAQSLIREQFSSLDPGVVQIRNFHVTRHGEQADYTAELLIPRSRFGFKGPKLMPSGTFVVPISGTGTIISMTQSIAGPVTAPRPTWTSDTDLVFHSPPDSGSANRFEKAWTELPKEGPSALFDISIPSAEDDKVPYQDREDAKWAIMLRLIRLEGRSSEISPSLTRSPAATRPKGVWAGRRWDEERAVTNALRTPDTESRRAGLDNQTPLK